MFDKIKMFFLHGVHIDSKCTKCGNESKSFTIGNSLNVSSPTCNKCGSYEVKTNIYYK